MKPQLGRLGHLLMNPRGVQWTLGAAAVVLGLGAILATGARMAGAGMAQPVVLLSFLMAIAVGESLRVKVIGASGTAPMSTAAGLALAMTSTAPRGNFVSVGAVTVIGVTALAMALALLVRVLRGRTVPVADAASRLLAVTATAVLFREVPVWHGRPLLRLQAVWADDRWLVAVTMILVSGLGLGLGMLLAGWVRATRAQVPLLRGLDDELRAVAALLAAVSVTAALIALAERPLGVVAIPLLLLPLLLLQFGMRRHSVVRRTYRQTIRALSRLTELGGFTSPGHSARVAELSLAIGRDLGIPARSVLDLEYAALLHDIGQVSLRTPIPAGATLMAAPVDQRRIAHDGAEIVRQAGVLDNVAVILEAQTTSYRRVRELGEDLPMPSRIIKVANAYDDLVGDRPDAARRAHAIERIHLGLGYEYDPRVVDALTRVIARAGS